MASTSGYSPEFLRIFKPELHYSEHPELMEKLHERMQPNNMSQVGFLAPGQNLAEICQKDAETLKARGITHEQIADRLEAVIMKANFLFLQRHEKVGFFSQEAKMSTPQAIIEDKLCVPKYESTLGHQECPFSKDINIDSTICGRGSSWINIINISSKKCISNITELHAHLIKDHHFFEGNPFYRLDPELAIEVLGIEPNIDYKVKTLTKTEWDISASKSYYEQEDLQAAREHKIEDIMTPEFEAYLLPYDEWKNSNGRQYLHIFKFSKQLTEQDYKIGNTCITGKQIKMGLKYTVYKIQQSIYPIFADGDRIEEIKKN